MSTTVVTSALNDDDRDWLARMCTTGGLHQDAWMAGPAFTAQDISSMSLQDYTIHRARLLAAATQQEEVGHGPQQ